jgi:hypothetical protein
MATNLAPGDREALENIVRQLETAWNAMDGSAFAAPFAGDADLRTIYAGSTNHCTMEVCTPAAP